MADKLGILINTILNVKQEDLQKQLDSVAKKIKINLKPRIDFDENVIAKFKSDVDKLAKNIKLNLRFDVDKQSVKDAEKTVTETAKKISEKSKSQNAKIKVFDKEQLESEGRQFFISATDIANRVKNQFKDLGDVNVNFLKNAKNQIVGFEAEIKKLDGTIEQLRFDMAKIKVGDSTKEGFVFSGANLIDKNIGDVLQRNLNTLQKFETRLRNIRDSFTSSRGVKDVTNLNILNKEYNSILSTIEKLRKSQSNLTEEQKRNIDKQINTLNSLYKAYRDIEITAEKGFNFKQYQEVSDGFNKIKTAQEGFNTSLLKNHKLVRASVQETEQYLKINQELQKGNWIKDVGVYVDKATGKMYQFQNAQRNIMVDTLTWSKAITTALKRMAQWAISGTLIFGTLRQIKEGIQYIHELDDAIVDLTKVVDLSNQQINEMAQSAIDLGKKLGKSSVEIMSGMAEWGRFTKNIEEIKELTRVATMASNVSDLSVQEASKLMTTAMIDYKLQVKDMMPLLDSFNEIQNNMRVSAKDLADGISKVGNAAAQSKTPIADLQGYISAIVQSTGAEGSEVGTALKSAISRVYRLGADGEEDAGKAEEQLNRIGVAVRDAYGNFRAFSDIINDVAKKWSTLNNVQQVAVAQAIGGTHHYSKIIGLFENFDLAVKATTLSLNSEGSALRENEKYINSITGRIERLNTSWQDFTNSLLSSDVFKGIISFITAIVNGMNTIPGKIALIVSSVTLLIMAIITFKRQIVAAGIAVKGFLTSLGPIGWITLAISALTTVVLGVANAFSEAKKSQEEFIQTTKQQINELQQQIEEAQNLFDTYRTATEGSKEYNEARRKLAETFPSLIVGYDNEGNAILANNEAIKEQIELLKQQTEEKRKLLQETAEDTIRQGQQNINKLQNKINKINKQIEKLKYYRDNPDELGTLESGTGYATRAEIIAMKNEQIADAQRKLAEVGEELREENNKLRETYVALVPPMDDMSEAQKKVANDFINSAIAEQKYIEQGNFNRKAFIEGFTEAINNVELLKKAEAELAEQSKKTSQGSFDLSKSYEDLLKSISNTSDDLKTLNQVIADVRNGQSLSAETILDLIEKYDLSVDAIKKTSDGYTVELSALENVRKAKIQTALDSIEAEKKHALAVKEQVESRLKNYGLEIEQLKNIAAVKAKLAEQADKEARRKADEITGGASDSGIRNRIYGQVYKEYMDKAGADVDLARKTLAEIEELEKKSKLLITILNDGSYGVSSSKSSSSKNSKANLSDLETRYIALEQAIEKVNKALEHNKDIVSNATDLDKIQLLNEQNELYRKQQNLLHQLNQERRKELAENKATLAKQGFKFDAEGMITNLSHIKGKSKEIEEVFQNYLSLLDKIRNTSSEWNDIMGEIINNTLDIDDLGLMEFDKQIENINNQISLLGDIDTDEELIRQSELLSQSYDVLSQKLTYVTSKIEEYRIELEKLQPTTDANKTKIAMLKSQLEEFEKKKIEIEIELVQKKDNLKSILDDRLNAYKSIQDKIVAMLKQKYQDELEARKKAINEELDALEKAHKEKIKLYEDEKKHIKELIDEKLKLIDREESERDYNQKLAELNEEKAEIQRKLEELSLDDSIESRNKQVELRKQLAEKEKEIAELVHDREVELRKDNLKDQLERYEKDIEAKIDAENKKYDYQKSKLEQELEDVKEYYEKKLEKANLYHEANKMLMTQSFDELYRQLAEFEDKFGDGMTAMGDKIKEELIENLKIALGLINEINNGGSITAYTSTTSVKSGSTTTNQSKRSTDENSNKVVGVRSYIQSKGYKVDYDRKTKQVYVNGKKLNTSMFTLVNDQYQGRISDIEKALNNIGFYSKGGKIDYTGLAMVHGSKDKPEYVFNYDQFKDLAKMIATYQFIPNINMPDFKSIQVQPNTSLYIDKLIEVQGNIDKSVLPDIEKIANKVVDKINSSLKLRGINRPAFGV